MGLDRRIVGINNGLEPSPGGSLLLSSGVDDQILLECMVQDRSDLTLTEALNDVIAQQFLEAGFITDGPRLVLALSGIIRRYMRKAGIKKEVDFQDRYLYELAATLNETSLPVERVDKGIELGDRAVHLASGWIGSRDMVRHWSSSDLRGYGEKMAFRGYGTAVDTASKLEVEGRRVASSRVSSIEFLMRSTDFRERMGKIIAVLSSLKPKKDDLESLLERMRNSDMVLGEN